ncbi:hypothetical protein DL98DRAFT_566470 [Cadophora sp. DSE1049]|nr:hypothetical protein DL98DRAFT_566470 [Cadophora sp. DSE1049]
MQSQRNRNPPKPFAGFNGPRVLMGHKLCVEKLCELVLDGVPGWKELEEDRKMFELMCRVADLYEYQEQFSMLREKVSEAQDEARQARSQADEKVRRNREKDAKTIADLQSKLTAATKRTREREEEHRLQLQKSRDETSLQKAWDRDVKALEEQLASAYQDSAETHNLLVTERADHVHTQETLHSTKSKYGKLKVSVKEKGTSYQEMKKSMTELEVKVRSLSSNSQAEQIRTDSAISHALADAEVQNSVLQRQVVDLSETVASLTNNAKSLSSWRGQVEAAEEALETKNAELKTTKGELATIFEKLKISEEKRCATESELEG